MYEDDFLEEAYEDRFTVDTAGEDEREEDGDEECSVYCPATGLDAEDQEACRLCCHEYLYGKKCCTECPVRISDF